METKSCPYCGETIMATAKKCRHCGEWLPDEDVVEELQESTEEVSAEEEDRVEGTGFLYFQIGCVAIGVWIAFTWWWALIAAIGMLILLAIPGIGHVMSVVLGAAVGAIAGAVAVAFHAPTWAAWVIGSIVGIGAIGINLDQRKNYLEE